MLDQIKKFGLDKSVTYFGNVPESLLNKLYDAADMIVIPSLYDAMPIVALEALAMESPSLLLVREEYLT